MGSRVLLTGAEVAIFNQYLALGSMTGGVSTVINFDRGIIYNTKRQRPFIVEDGSHHASQNLHESSIFMRAALQV